MSYQLRIPHISIQNKCCLNKKKHGLLSLVYSEHYLSNAMPMFKRK